MPCLWVFAQVAGWEGDQKIPGGHAACLHVLDPSALLVWVAHDCLGLALVQVLPDPSLCDGCEWRHAHTCIHIYEL